MLFDVDDADGWYARYREEVESVTAWRHRRWEEVILRPAGSYRPDLSNAHLEGAPFEDEA